jgi:hypothetical protein
MVDIAVRLGIGMGYQGQGSSVPETCTYLLHQKGIQRQPGLPAENRRAVQFITSLGRAQILCFPNIIISSLRANSSHDRNAQGL